MYNYKRGIIVLAVISLMIFTPLMAVFPLTSAQTTGSSAVGTVIFNPSNGAFPGQIVTYTWYGLPESLVSPIYVTVYLNGVPYSTGLANYSITSTGGVLTGSFVMPNDQPGTTFMVSLSYKDSANNYGVSSLTTGTGTANVYTTPSYLGTTDTTTIKSTLTGVPLTVLATVNYSGVKNVKENFGGVKGYDAGYANSSYNSSIQSKTIYPSVNQTLYSNENVSANYSSAQVLSSTNNTQNITVNATAYNPSKTLPLSLAASTGFNSTFNGNYYYNKKEINITSIQLKGYINQTVQGQKVDFEVNAIYTSTIYNTTGTYTATGQLYTLEPQQLKNNFTGSASVTWDITSLKITSVNGSYYVNITYTLSVKLLGNTNHNLVYLDASYLNATPVNASFKSTSSPGTFSSYKIDTLVVQSGYSFYGTEVDLENPGISGIIYNEAKITSSQTSPLISTTMFSNFTKLYLSTIAPGNKIVFNQTGKTAVSISESNLTFSGYVNITIVSESYSPGVTYIENATWTFTVNFQYNITNKTYGIYLSGTGEGNGFVSANNSVVVSVATTSISSNVEKINEIGVTSFIKDKVGYPYLTSLNGVLTYTLNYTTMSETAKITQNFSLKGSVNLSKSASSPYTLITNLQGFNTSLGGNISLYVNASKNFSLVLFGLFVSMPGYANDSLYIGGTVTFNSHVSEVLRSNLTYHKGTTVFNYNNSYGSVWKYSLSNETNVSYTLSEVWGEAQGYTTEGFASFALSSYYGYVNITGKSNKISGQLNLWSINNTATSTGNITSTVGFENTSILGYYNTTYQVIKSYPALYGLSSMNGMVNVNVTVHINNVSHSVNTDPYFVGQQNVTSLTLIIYSTKAYSNTTYNQSDSSANLTVTGLGYKGYLGSLTVLGNFEATDPLYNLTNYYSYSATFKKIPFQANYNDTITSNLTFEMGDVYTAYNGSTTTLYSNISSPLKNLTLAPSPNLAIKFQFDAQNGLEYYYLNGSMASPNVYFKLPLANNSTVSITSNLSGSYEVSVTTVPGTIILQGYAGGLTYTSNPFNALNGGSIPISGTVTSEHGSGTFAGWFNVSKYYPVNPVNGGSLIWGSGYIKLQEFSANGSQYYSNVTLQTGVIGIYMYNSSSSMLNTMYDLWNIEESPNMATSPQYSFQLLNGSGAMITGINNTMVAEIATLTGKYVNMSISQLNAKIVGIYSELNNTYVTINTNYGVMEAQLTALNANITAVSNGVATIQTSLGTVQASLNALNTKIVAINGTIATIKTDIGTINTTVSSINAQLTSIQGNIATVQTSLGTLQGTVTSINGPVATIKTIEG
jgi:prefoldin subunit 5